MPQQAPRVSARSQSARILHTIEAEAEPLIALARQALVEDVAVNPDRTVWVKQTGSGWKLVDTFSSKVAERLLLRLASRTRPRTHFDSTHPVIEVNYDGHRVTGICEPVVRGTAVAIRPLPKVARTLQDWVDSGILTHREDPANARQDAADFGAMAAGRRHDEILRMAVLARRNIVLAGGPGAGKTTFLNTLVRTIADLTPNDRLILIEDLPELDMSPVPNHVSLVSNVGFSMGRCLRVALRLSAHRIFVGEVRNEDNAANTLLNAWNTGHTGGLASVHADDAILALRRFEQLIAHPDVHYLRSIIAQAVHLVVFIDHDAGPTGRKVRQIIQVRGYDAQTGYQLTTL